MYIELRKLLKNAVIYYQKKVITSENCHLNAKKRINNFESHNITQSPHHYTNPSDINFVFKPWLLVNGPRYYYMKRSGGG
jgi:hypothetical protein